MIHHTNMFVLRSPLLAALAALAITLACDDSELDGSAPASLEVDSQETEWRGGEGMPSEDGFVNPLNPVVGVTEAHDGDGYYNALDWKQKNPGVGSHHCGEDWNYESGGDSDFGKPVYATANGIVVNAGHYGKGWGKILMIKHYIPRAGHQDYVFITSTYAHLNSYSVSVGDVVERGQKIGTIGDADGEWPAHLHFEMRWNEDLGPGANHGYQCPDAASGTFDPTDFIDAHPPGW